MFSRYSVMGESRVLDSSDQTAYPDPLSVNYNNTQLSQMPKRRRLDVTDLQRFWMFMLKQYRTIAEADDVLLTLNNIPYRGALTSGDVIYVIDVADLYGFSTFKKPS